MTSTNQIAEALPIIEKAHELTPAKQAVSLQLASLYMNTGKKEEASALIKQVYESDPTYPEGQKAYFASLILLGQEAEARTIFGTTTGMFDSLQAAQAYAGAKQYPKAIAIFKNLIAKDPADIQLQAQLAQIQYEAGMISAAIETLRTIGKNNPELKAQAEAAILQIQAK